MDPFWRICKPLDSPCWPLLEFSAKYTSWEKSYIWRNFPKCFSTCLMDPFWEICKPLDSPCWPLLEFSAKYTSWEKSYIWRNFPKCFSTCLMDPFWEICKPLLDPSGNFLQNTHPQRTPPFWEISQNVFPPAWSLPFWNFLGNTPPKQIHSKDISQDAFQGKFSFCSYKAEVFYLPPLAGPFWNFLLNGPPERNPIFGEIPQIVFPPAWFFPSGIFANPCWTLLEISGIFC